MSVIPDSIHSSIMYDRVGLSTIGSISFGTDLVIGKNLVPNPATGITAFVIFCLVKGINTINDKLKRKEEQPAAPTTKKCPFCKSEIALDATKCAHCTSDVE